MSKAGVMLPKVWQPYVDKLERENDELRATIERVRGLPEKWRKDELPKVSADEPSIKDAWDDGWVRSQRNCADELEAALND